MGCTHQEYISNCLIPSLAMGPFSSILSPLMGNISPTSEMAAFNILIDMFSSHKTTVDLLPMLPIECPVQPKSLSKDGRD